MNKNKMTIVLIAILLVFMTLLLSVQGTADVNTHQGALHSENIIFQYESQKNNWHVTGLGFFGFEEAYSLKNLFKILSVQSSPEVQLHSPSPAQGAIDTPVDPYLNITVNERSGAMLTIMKRTNVSGSWETLSWLNNTGNMTMVNKTIGVFDAYSTKMWWSVNVSSQGLWVNQTYSFTTTGITTQINPLPQYTQTHAVPISATAPYGLSNVTLCYRYSPDNATWCNATTDFNESDYNVTMTFVDYLSELTDPAMDYVNELVLNDGETVLYIVSHADGSLCTIDVTNPKHMVKLDEFDNASTMRAHSVDYFNYTAVGLPYGEIVFLSQFSHAKTFVSFNVSEPDNIQYMDTVITNYISRGMYADVVYHNSTGEVIAALTGYNGSIVVLNVTDPNQMTVIGHLNLGPTHEVWFPWFDENNNDYLYCTKNNGFGTNHSMPLIDVSDPTSLVVIDWMPFTDWPTRWSQVGHYLYGGDRETEKIYVINVTDPLNWTMVNNGADVDFGAVHDSFHHPILGDFIIGHAKEQDRLRAVYINEGVPTIAGDVKKTTIYDTTHSVVLKSDGSVIFGSTFIGIDEVHATKIEFNGAGDVSGWTPYATDVESPWNWMFTFPKGPGYYEFCSIGRKSGSPDERPSNSGTVIAQKLERRMTPVMNLPFFSARLGVQLQVFAPFQKNPLDTSVFLQ